MLPEPVFTSRELDFGLAYAKNEYDIHLHAPFFATLATLVYAEWSPKRKEKDLEDVKDEVLNNAFKIEFRRTRNARWLHKEVEAYSGAIGKVINNRGNMHRPGHKPDRRMGPHRPRKPRVTEESTGQMSIKF